MHLQTVSALAASAVVASLGAEGAETGIWWIAFAEKFGVTAALLLYFVIRDIQNAKRSDKERGELVTKLTTLEDRLQSVTNDYLSRQHDAINKSNEVGEQLVKVLNRHFAEH